MLDLVFAFDHGGQPVRIHHAAALGGRFLSVSKSKAFSLPAGPVIRVRPGEDVTNKSNFLVVGLPVHVRAFAFVLMAFCILPFRKIMEMLYSIKRARPEILITYFVKDVARQMQKCS